MTTGTLDINLSIKEISDSSKNKILQSWKVQTSIYQMHLNSVSISKNDPSLFIIQRSTGTKKEQVAMANLSSFPDFSHGVHNKCCRKRKQLLSTTVHTKQWA